MWRSRPGREVAAASVRAGRVLGARGLLLVVLGVGGVASFLLALAAARVYDAVTDHDGVAVLDMPVLHLAMAVRSPLLDHVSAGIAVVFGPVGMPVVASAACVVLAVRRRSVMPVLLTVAAGLGSLLMTVAGKDVVGRHRPPLVDAVAPFEHSPSFPSGHTLNATVICGVLAYLLLLRSRTTARRVAVVGLAGVVVAGVGASRVLLGAHWFTDVLAGWLLGGAWLAVVVTAHRVFLTVRQRAGRVGVLP